MTLPRLYSPYGKAKVELFGQSYSNSVTLAAIYFTVIGIWLLSKHFKVV